MSKRFTDTEKWDDPWYRRLKPEQKNFWDYLCAHCDNAGVWKPDFDLASFCIGLPIEANVLAILNDTKERIKILSNGYWWIIGYVDFQYGGEIKNPKVKKHVSSLVRKYTDFGYPINTLSIPNTLGMHTPKDKDKDMDKEKDIGINTKRNAVFIAPTLVEVTKFQQERHSIVIPQIFIDFYASKGWMVGKTKMKDWKAAFRNAEGWERWKDGNKQKIKEGW